MNFDQILRRISRRQSQSHDRHVTASSRRFVHERRAGKRRQRHRLPQGLRLDDDVAALEAVGRLGLSSVAVIPRSQHDGLHAVDVVLSNAVAVGAFRLFFLFTENDGIQNDDFVPGNEFVESQRQIRISPELKHDGATAVDHEVEPAVVASHREAFLWQVGRDADPDEADARGRHHAAPNNRRTTKNETKDDIKSYFDGGESSKYKEKKVGFIFSLANPVGPLSLQPGQTEAAWTASQKKRVPFFCVSNSIKRGQ